MRPAVWLCLAIAASLSLSIARAEPRRTIAAATLRKKPGEHEAAVAQLPAHTPVTVLGLEGRWLRVRALSAEGYLTRTQVTEADAAPAPTGQWSASRSPSAVLGSAAARTDRGASTAVNAAGSRDDGGAAAVASPLGVLEPFAVRVELGAGLRTLGMALTSNAEGGLANYVLDADAMAATLDALAVRRSGRWLVAADARGSGSNASPGIDYPGPTAPAGKIPFRTLAADAGVRLGGRVRVFDLALRAGGHYDAFLAGTVRNAGMLPRERLLGATLGARIDIAPEGSRFTASARFDALVVGARAQTAGLEDGESSKARALWGGATMRYALWPRLAVLVGYDFERASTEWSGMSARQPGVTRTRRIDTSQLIQLGISTAL